MWSSTCPLTSFLWLLSHVIYLSVELRQSSHSTFSMENEISNILLEIYTMQDEKQASTCHILTSQVTIYMKTNLLFISVLKSVPSIWKISIDKCLSQICNEILVQECISWHCQILTVIFLPLENFCSCKHGVFICKITFQAFSNVTKSNSIILSVSLVVWWNNFPNI